MRRILLPLLLLSLNACVAPAFSNAWLVKPTSDTPAPGAIHDGATGGMLSANDLRARLLAADVVLLGEHHDHPDHHRIQGELLRLLVDAGQRPTVVFEMLDAAQQPAIDAALATHPTPDAFAAAVGWEKSGWPDFNLYRPVFDVALGAGLPVAGGDLEASEARSIVRGGVDVLPADLVALKDAPLDDSLRSEWEREMADSHCGHLPASMLGPMVLAQRARDLRLANVVSKAAARGPVVLIAGSGHVRKDRAVPAWLGRMTSGSKVFSLAFDEVGPSSPASFPQPFDVVVTTPHLARPDPCAAFRK